MKKDAKVVRTYEDKETGAKLNVYSASATVKDKATGKKKVVWEGEYHEPVSLEDGLLFDGEENVEKTWKSERYTNFLDSKRREATDSKKALMAKLIQALEAGDVIQAAEIMKELGLKTANLKAIIAEAQTEPEEDDTEETEEEEDAE